MPPIPAGVGGVQHGPSVFDKLKMGALMGSSTVTIFQYGAGQAGVMRTLGKYMLASGGTFGVFMSIGSVIRNEESPIYAQASEAYRRAHYPPIIMPRRDTYSAKKREE
ncbi:putative mitochondrial genome maintenance protein [Phaeomoniella chlamydospora]|uniref:Putative mitochondrial genome maintenance protein n=1 Tax=Phaeomoniella chlamydospora TaxID=158046 RepID=A0A0G2EPN3_PHACM|nr:putative mitochondrial genome maintenance protein [Phaeomoniella chlamydospora]